MRPSSGRAVPVAAAGLALLTALVVGASGGKAAPLPAPAAPPATSQVQQQRAQAATARRVLDARALAALGQHAVRGRLARRSVLVVTLPGTSPAPVHAVNDALRSAGARVSGRLELLPPFLAPARARELETLVLNAIPPGVQLPAERRTGTVPAAVLSRAFVSPREPDIGEVVDAGRILLSALTSGGFAKHQGAPAGGATLVVVLAPATLPGAAENQSALELVSALHAGGAGAVLAATHGSAAPGRLVAAARASTRPARPATIDAVDTAAGPYAVVLALAQQAAAGSGASQPKPAQGSRDFGDGPGARAAFPDVR